MLVYFLGSFSVPETGGFLAPNFAPHIGEPNAFPAQRHYAQKILKTVSFRVSPRSQVSLARKFRTCPPPQRHQSNQFLARSQKL
jgi:hypothetical protein